MVKSELCENLSSKMSQTLLFKYLHITFVVALYWTVSIVQVFVNKTLLTNVKLEAPFFILWYQCFISIIICLFMKAYSRLFPGKFSFPDGSPFRLEAIFNVFPISFLLTCTIVFNALCLKYVGVSFYYIGRSLTTIFNVVLSYLILHHKISTRTLVCCSVIVIGFFLGIDQENVLGTFSLLGTAAGIVASLSLAFYSVYTKQALSLLDNSIWLLSYYNNIYALILLSFFVVATGEIPVIVSYGGLYEYYFWFLMSIGGIFGFSMGYVTSLQIQVTSPLTHNISGTAKACAQTLIATIWYSESKTFIWWISNYVILAGSFAYARVKQIELMQKFTSEVK